MLDPTAPKVLAGIFIFTLFFVAYVAEWVGGHIQRARRPWRDALFTLCGMTAQISLNGAALGALAGVATLHWFPHSANALAETPFWLAYGVIFVAQEFAHYWIHRFAHEWRWLWRLHRTHHSATDMNVGVVFRYNIFWVLLLPQAWLAAFGVYFGVGWPTMAAIATTFLVNVLTHTSSRWDLALRNAMPWSEPFWRVLERVITLPDTHHAHHGYGKDAHPNGNYAITLFIFDTVFGTAKIPHKQQEVLGLPISERLHWAEELFWPVVQKPLAEKQR